MVSTGQWRLRGPCQVACKLTHTLPPSSLVQALLTVLSQVLCFLAIEWYLPLLVSSLVLGWLNLLYYTRGFQHTGIYSVMIQKVRGRGGPAATRLGGLDIPLRRDSFWLQQAGEATRGRGGHEYVLHVPRCSMSTSRSMGVHIPALSGLRSAHASKYLPMHVCKCPHRSTHILVH